MAAVVTQTNKSLLSGLIGAVLGAAATLGIAGNAYANADADWTARSTAAGVVMATRFDTLAEVANDTFPDSTQDHVSWETNNKASGNGSLRMDVLRGDYTSSGSWVRYLADDQREFGTGDTFYVQFRQFFPTYFATTAFTGNSNGFGGGWKQTIISHMSGSNQLFEVVLQNTRQRGIVQGYNRNSNGDYLGWEDFISTPCNSLDFVYQNQIDRGGPETTCLESRRKRGGLYSAGYADSGTPDPETGAFIYYPNEWLTFLVRVDPGTFGGGASLRDSRVRVWAAREADTEYTFLIDQMINLGAESNNGTPYYFNAIWLLPYHTNRTPQALSEPDTYVLYDEVIVSTNPIAAPGGGVIGGDLMPPAQVLDLAAD